jgi:hypothetical protein
MTVALWSPEPGARRCHLTSISHVSLNVPWPQAAVFPWPRTLEVMALCCTMLSCKTLRRLQSEARSWSNANMQSGVADVGSDLSVLFELKHRQPSGQAKAEIHLQWSIPGLVKRPGHELPCHCQPIISTCPTGQVGKLAATLCAFVGEISYSSCKYSVSSPAGCISGLASPIV